MKAVNALKIFLFVIFTTLCGESFSLSFYEIGQPEVKMITFFFCLAGFLIGLSVIKSQQVYEDKIELE